MCGCSFFCGQCATILLHIVQAIPTCMLWVVIKIKEVGTKIGRRQ
jgi:hypothetical protein